MKFNKLKTTAFNEIIYDAGMILKNFDPTGTTAVTDADILFTTSGGVNGVINYTFLDLGDGVDNAPLNTKEFKQIDDVECRLSGTSLTATLADLAKSLPGSKISGDKLTISKTLADTDFQSIWYVADRKDGGMIAINLLNALNTGGLNFQSVVKGNGTFAFDFLGHFSSAEQDRVPMEIYIADPEVTPEG